MALPDITNGWLVVILFVGLLTLAILKIDSWTTAGLSILIGYVTGAHIQASQILNNVQTETPTQASNP